MRLEAAGAWAELRPECGGTIDELHLLPETGGAEAPAIMAGQPASERAGCEPGLFRGRLLAPFSDRIPGGVYEFLGERQELPINDQENGDAIHGFLYDHWMEPVDRSPDAVTLVHRISGEFPGYPFGVDIQARYLLEPCRFRLTLTARNLSHQPAPVTLGWHPYFVLPKIGRVDELRLQLPAERYVAVDERLLPTGELPSVRGTPWDFSTPRQIGSQEIDLGFRLSGDRVTLAGRSHTLEMHLSGAFGYCQVFVPPDRESIAIEPLTGATNAFNRPELGLAVLYPGDWITGECLVTLR